MPDIEEHMDPRPPERPEDLTTAQLADGKPASTRQVAEEARSFQPRDGGDTAPLLATDEVSDLRERWTSIQAGFVGLELHGVVGEGACQAAFVGEPVDHADLLRRDGLAAAEPVEGRSHADESRQVAEGAPAGDQAQEDLGAADPGLDLGLQQHPVATAQGQLEPPAEADAVDHRHRRDPQRGEPAEDDLPEPAILCGLRGRPARAA